MRDVSMQVKGSVKVYGVLDTVEYRCVFLRLGLGLGLGFRLGLGFGLRLGLGLGPWLELGQGLRLGLRARAKAGYVVGPLICKPVHGQA